MQGDLSSETVQGGDDWAHSQPAGLVRVLHRLESRGELDEDTFLDAFCFLPKVARVLELAVESLRDETAQQSELLTAYAAADASNWEERPTGAQLLRQKRRELEHLADALLIQYFPRMKQAIQGCFGGAELSELRLEQSLSRLERELEELRDRRKSLERQLREVAG
ncbi:hypothetical protein F1559_001946 [Cyanidiococcus yangmingshanensis]|uniref:Uncharacterized protein n=1 Tax=Cyanidiococcus yangmingshanensis TaxID=2690220 RepID=A0A7J7IJ40_9RHOD|nr:hypothetical protein F1559_001946 [Cyanidiococcus yangmingshanensis]